MFHFVNLSLETQDSLLERHSSSTACVLSGGQASPAAAVSANDPGDDGDDWDLNDAAWLEDVERVVAKRLLRIF